MNVSTAPLMENEYVKELFAIMEDSGKDSSGLAALIGHVSEMENFVKRAEDLGSMSHSFSAIDWRRTRQTSSRLGLYAG